MKAHALNTLEGRPPEEPEPRTPGLTYDA
jgi:hypothetical protein